MKRSDSDLEPELAAFLAHGSVERHLPSEVRARALARARSIIAGGGLLPPGPLRELKTPARPPVARWRTVARVACAGSIAAVLGFVGQVVASRGRVASRQPPPSVAGPAALPAVLAARPATPALPEAAARTQRPASVMARPRREVPSTDLFVLELELLQRAQAAYTRRDYATALELLADHARLFPRGSLAEEREALRVRSLLASGRRVEAHRAAAAFARRFPYSVLVPRVDDRESALE